MTDRWNRLATYNAERARGIEHTTGWKMLMEEEQERFDAEQFADTWFVVVAEYRTLPMAEFDRKHPGWSTDAAFMRRLAAAAQAAAPDATEIEQATE